MQLAICYRSEQCVPGIDELIPWNWWLNICSRPESESKELNSQDDMMERR